MATAMSGSRLRKAERGCAETAKVQIGKRPQDIDGIETTIVAMKGNSD